LRDADGAVKARVAAVYLEMEDAAISGGDGNLLADPVLADFRAKSTNHNPLSLVCEYLTQS
jgi:hypothetical protein